MLIYLLFPLPALIIALFRKRLSNLNLLFIWIVTSALMIALMPYGSRDYSTYLQDFTKLNGESFEAVLGQDPLYSAFVWIAGHLGVRAGVFYSAFAVFSFWIKLTALRKLSRGSSIVILVYMCSFFFLHDFTQLRASLAIGIWMHAIAELPRSYLRYMVLTFVATLIHLQAALGFLLFGLLLIMRTRINGIFFILITIGITCISPTHIFDQLGREVFGLVPDPRVQIYLIMAAQGFEPRPNPFNVINLLALLSAVFGLLARRPLNDEYLQLFPSSTSPVAAIYFALLLGGCALTLLSAVPVAAFRVSENFFSLLPVGLWLSICRGRPLSRNRFFLWIVAFLLLYIFIFYSPYLRDPFTTGF